MDGDHAIERCDVATRDTLAETFAALRRHRVRFDGMLLKPNMIVPGDDSDEQADADTVAAATLRCLRRHVPPAVPGVVFLSGGQRDVMATQNLDAMNRAGGPTPWRLSFSYGRALQDAALATWLGRSENVQMAQRAFLHRSRCNHLAATADYSEVAEEQAEVVSAVSATWRDD
jgi:fructose-bisphosphate aldolase class I